MCEEESARGRVIRPNAVTTRAGRTLTMDAGLLAERHRTSPYVTVRHRASPNVTEHHRTPPNIAELSSSNVAERRSEDRKERRGVRRSEGPTKSRTLAPSPQRRATSAWTTTVSGSGRGQHHDYASTAGSQWRSNRREHRRTRTTTKTPGQGRRGAAERRSPLGEGAPTKFPPGRPPVPNGALKARHFNFRT